MAVAALAPAASIAGLTFQTRLGGRTLSARPCRQLQQIRGRPQGISVASASFFVTH